MCPQGLLDWSNVGELEAVVECHFQRADNPEFHFKRRGVASLLDGDKALVPEPVTARQLRLRHFGSTSLRVRIEFVIPVGLTR